MITTIMSRKVDTIDISESSQAYKEVSRILRALVAPSCRHRIWDT
jgi:hypothetical protein